MRRAVPILLALAALAAAVAWWSRDALVAGRPPVPRHVIVVSVDTLRADQLGPYGHPTVVTPTLDRLAAEGFVFEQDVSVAPTTLASHTSLFTGRYPHTHGVPRNDHAVNPDNLMLAEVLRDAGFATAAFLGAMPLASHSGFTQGFEHVDETFTEHRWKGTAQAERSATEVTDAVLGWLDARDDDRPLFLFVHYFDVHAPYDPPPRWRAHYAPDAPSRAGSLLHVARTRHRLLQHRPGASAHSEHLKRLYLGEVSYVDEELGRLVEGLRTRDLLDAALLVVTSDHGEAFDAHDELWDHGHGVWDETVRVPLIVRLPGGWRGGTRIPEQVAGLDLFPSVLDLLGHPIPPNEGTSWAPLLRGERDPARPPVFSEATKPHPIGAPTGWTNAPLAKGVRHGGWKLIVWPAEDRRALFHVARDPEERVDLAGRGEPVEAALGAALEAWRRTADPLPSAPTTDARVRAELAALGYVDDDPPEAAAPEDADSDVPTPVPTP